MDAFLDSLIAGIKRWINCAAEVGVPSIYNPTGLLSLSLRSFGLQICCISSASGLGSLNDHSDEPAVYSFGSTVDFSDRQKTTAISNKSSSITI